MRLFFLSKSLRPKVPGRYDPLEIPLSVTSPVSVHKLVYNYSPYCVRTSERNLERYKFCFVLPSMFVPTVLYLSHHSSFHPNLRSAYDSEPFQCSELIINFIIYLEKRIKLRKSFDRSIYSWRKDLGTTRPQTSRHELINVKTYSCIIIHLHIFTNKCFKSSVGKFRKLNWSFCLLQNLSKTK